MPKSARSPHFLGLLLGSTALVGMAMLPSTATAATAWIGTNSSDWYTAGNWDNGVPNNATQANIVSNSPNPTVINGGSAFTSTLNMYNGTSALTIQGGGVLSSTFGNVGADLGSTATVTVSGASAWSLNNLLRIGGTGTGTLNVSGGSTVNALNVTFGTSAGSSGTGTVTGPGSSLAAGLTVVVGESGTGKLTISNGATVTDTSATVGSLLGSTGGVTVNDATWTNAGQMTIGGQGTGTLTVENGGSVSNGTTSIGSGPAGTGTATITGPGSTMNAGSTYVGANGDGTLNILAGGVVSSTDAVLGYVVDARGGVTVDGAGSQWNIAAGLVVGDFGQGEMTVSAGGKLTSGDAIIGNDLTGVGKVTVTGAGSNWTNNTILDVGYLSTGSLGVPGGTLNVLSGGTVDTSYFNVATKAGSSGVVLIDGSGSDVTATHDSTIGFLGSANLTISNGGELNDVDGYIGRDVGGSGLVTVTGSGSEWNNSDDLFVGYKGFGELEILDGALVRNAFAQIGTLAGSAGKAKIDGAGSSWINSSALIVGQSGFGELGISGGGVVTSTGGVLGGTVFGQGVATVTGAGSSWSMTGGGLTVGYLGRGGLSILDGGMVSMSSMQVGFQAGSIGNVVINGAGSTLDASFLAYVGDQGDGTMTLSNGGTLATNTLVLANQAGSSGKLIIGSDLALAPVAAGSFIATNNPVPTLVFGDGDGTLIFNHTDDDYAFGAVLDGSGEIVQKFGTTRLTSDSAGFSGLATVTDGKLVFNADFSGTTGYVSNGGAIGGTGTLLNLIVSNAGTVTPGNSIGTLNVDNSATFNTGSTYEAEVNAAGASDLIDVAGVATINGGTVAALAAPGQYAPSTQYKIVTATGGVNGTYTGVTVNSAFLAASLSYDINDVFLTLDRINTTMFNDVGGTPNQKATGTGLDSVAVGNAAAEALALQSDAAKRAALDQLSGELHASIKSAELEDSRFVREAINSRLLENGTPDTLGLWSRGFGSFGTMEGDGNAAGLGRQTGGLFAGADGMLADGWRVGLLGGYGIGNYDVADRGSSASIESYNAAIYTGFEAGGFSFRLGADYAVHSIDTERTIAFTEFSDADIAAYASRTAQVFGEVGYKMEAGPAWLEPYAALAYVNHSTDGFSEIGGASALSAEADTLAATFTTLGLRAAAAIDLGEATGTLRGSLGWRHAFGDLTPTSTMAFAGGDLFTIAGVPLAADAAVVDLGFDVTLPGGASLGASYSGVISETGYDHGAKAELAWQF